MMQRIECMWTVWTRTVIVLVVSVGLVGVAAPAGAVGEGEAIIHEPFGVARLSIPLTTTSASHAYEIHDAQGRVLYPALRGGPLGALVTGLLGGDPETAPNRLNISFLFTGNAPLEVTVYTPEPQRFVLKPTIRPRRITERALQRWWRDYHAVARQQEQAGDYPPLIHTYLTTMLGDRLQLRPPLLGRVPQNAPGELQETMQLVFGAEKLRRAILRETLLGGGLGDVADRPLPAAIAWQAPESAESPVEADVEPLALHVPQECFYVRFGNFKNYLWLSGLLNTHGGDISQMVNLRAHRAGLNKKFERQLALKQSALAEFLGPQVIEDVS